MKAFLILCAIGLAACDKLDRTYLPPPGSITAGGDPGDLNLPLEFPTENYPSSLEAGNVVINDGSLSRPNYPNVALGIDRQGATITSADTFTTRPGVSLSKNIINIPTTTTSYAFTQTTTLTPVESYETGEVGRTQGYPSSISSLDYNLDSSQLPSQYNINSNKQYGPIVGSNVFGPNDNPIFQADSAFQQEPTVEFVSGTGLPGSQSSKPANSIVPELRPQDFYKVASIKNQDDIDTVSEMTIPTASTSYPDHYSNKQSSIIFKPQENSKYPELQDSINIHSHDSYNPTKVKKVSLTLLQNQFPENISSTPSVSISPFLMYSSDSLESKKNKLPGRIQDENDRNAVILNYDNTISPDGFAYSFDTSNRIHVDESGTAVNGVKAQGSYSYTGDDGKIYSIVYTADENGFLPRGDHLPTPPPIPDAILKVIEQAEKNKELGIFDDGSYDDAKYGHGKYQGLMDRLPLNQFNNYFEKQPAFKKNIITNNTAFNEEGGMPSSSGKHLEDVNSENTGDITSGSAYHKNKDIINEKESSTSDKDINNFPDQATQLVKEYNGYSEDINQFSPMGYKYNHPQKTFNYSDGRTFNSYEENSKDKPVHEIESDGTTVKPFITPNVSFNFKSFEKSGSNLQPTKENLIHQILTSGQNSPIQPKAPIFYNRGPEKTDDGHNTVAHIFSTRKPEFGSTIYNYQSPYSSKIIDKLGQHSDDPTSTLGSQYASSTTPLPSESSRIIPSSDSGNYVKSSPITSEYPSKLRYSVPSVTPASVIQSPSYKHNYESVKYHNGFEPSFGVSNPRYHKLQTISQPKTFEEQTSTERVIGEDFTGPKQSQRFDPENGYYY